MKPLFKYLNQNSDKRYGFLKSWPFRSGLKFQQVLSLKLEASETFLRDPVSYLETRLGRSLKSLSGSNISLTLSDEDILTRKVKLPKAVGNHSNKALKLEVQKAVPIPIDKLIWKSEHLGDVGDTQHHALTIAKADRLTLIEKAFETIGLNVTEFYAHSILLKTVKPKMSEKLDKAWFAITLILVAATLGWLSWLNWSSLQETTKRLDSERTQIAALRDKVIIQTNDAQNKSAALEAAQLVLSEVNLGRSNLTILNSLSHALGDGTWISQWDRTKDKINISGFSDVDIPKLVQQISNLDLVSAVKQKTASQRDRLSKKIRFQLEITLKSKATP